MVTLILVNRVKSAEFEDNETQIKVLKLLSALLPVPNRDTLKVLLEFLAKVHYWSDDRVGKNGEEVKYL